MNEINGRLDGRIIADQQAINALGALARFGHLRTEEVRLILWPQSDAKDGRQRASRLLRRMSEHGMVLARPNSIGGQAYVLTGAGARFVTARLGLPASDGYDIQGVSGPQYWHRTLTTAFLLQAFDGPAELSAIWGEYAIGKGLAPVGRGEIRQRFLKLPDCLARIQGPKLSLAWVEVESSFKPESELDKIFHHVGRRLDTDMNVAETVRLGELWIVYDVSQGHEKRLVAAARRAIRARDLRLPGLVTFWRCRVALPLQLLDVEPVKLTSLLGGAL